MIATQVFGVGLAVAVSIAAYRTIKNRRSKNRILIVVTSHDQLGNTGQKTGFWLEELAAPYYALKDAGFEVVLASPKGGKPPIDPKSSKKENQTESTNRFNSDLGALKELDNTKKLCDVDEREFAAIFYAGGHGPLWDLAEDSNSCSLIEKFHNAKKPIASVCHGPGVFKKTKFVVAGLNVTGFSNEEEKAVKLESVVPFSVENMLKENGAKYTCGPNWQPYVVKDNNSLLITGQNPASSVGVAQVLTQKLRG